VYSLLIKLISSSIPVIMSVALEVSGSSTQEK
jgi:hypothetical protein